MRGMVWYEWGMPGAGVVDKIMDYCKMEGFVDTRCHFVGFTTLYVI